MCGKEEKEERKEGRGGGESREGDIYTISLKSGYFIGWDSWLSVRATKCEGEIQECLSENPGKGGSQIPGRSETRN